MRPRMIGAAGALQPGPMPRWRVAADDIDVLAVVPLDDHRVLVSAKGQSLHDLRTGTQLWSQDSIPGDYRLLAVEPLVFIGDKRVGTPIVAVEPATGRILWRRALDKPARIAVDDANRRLIVMQRPDSQTVRLVATGLRSDSVAWSREYKAGTLPQLMTRGDSAFLVGKPLTLLSLSKGDVRWIADGVPAADVTPVARRALAASESGTLSLIEHDGRILWQDSLPGILAAYSADERNVYLARFDSSILVLSARSLADGSVAWRRELPGKPTSHVVRADSLLLFTTATGDSGTLHVWSASTGVPLTAARLPTQTRRMLPDSVVRARVKDVKLIVYRFPCAEFPLTEVNALPDQLVLIDGTVVVTQETRISGYSTEGRLLWTYQVESPEVTAACVRYNQILVVEQARGARWSSAVTDMAASLDANSRHSLALDRAQSQRSHEQRVASMSSTSAGRSLLPAAYSARAAEVRMQSQFAATQSVLAFQAAAQNVADIYFYNRDFLPLRRRVEWMGDIARQSHFDAISGEWFVRAFARGTRVGKGKASWVPCRSIRHGIYGKSCDGFEGRTGVLLVNLRDGRWAELTTGVYESGIDMLSLNMHLPAFSPDSRLLLVSAGGRDTSGWGAGNRDVYRLLTVPQSVAAYHLDSISFNAPAAYARRQVVIRGLVMTQEQRISSIKPGDSAASVAAMLNVVPVKVDETTVNFDSLIERNGRVALERVQCAIDAENRVSRCTAAAWSP